MDGRAGGGRQRKGDKEKGEEGGSGGRGGGEKTRSRDERAVKVMDAGLATMCSNEP